MRYIIAILLAACGPVHGTAYLLHYDVAPRKLVLSAIDAARELHYDLVALESPDMEHNAFLALADRSTKTNATGLLVQIAFPDEACPPSGCGSIDMPTQIAITPLAWHNGHELPTSEVPAATKAQAEQLMYTIYDRNRGNRHLNANL